MKSFPELLSHVSGCGTHPASLREGTVLFWSVWLSTYQISIKYNLAGKLATAVWALMGTKGQSTVIFK